jgi:carboxyl-terminal processing protease
VLRTNDKLSLLRIFGPALVLAACSQPGEHHDAPATLAQSATTSAKTPSSTNALLTSDDEASPQPFTSGAHAFEKVRDTLLRNYYAEGLSEDDVYRAATVGMLERLDPKMKSWNKLLSPREVAELQNDLKGEVVGIGVQIEFDEKSGYADVLATLPGSPSEKAGLLSGDKVVTVNGKLYKGMHLKDVVGDIRGKAGEPVSLSVLRGDKLVSFTITRERVTYDQPDQIQLGDGIGVIRIPSFTDKTPPAVHAALEELARANTKGLIVDVRRCPGGSFDRAVETVEQFLPEGTPIVTLRRKNKVEEIHLSKGKPLLADVPVVVLADEETASSGEILTGTLREGRHARVVGEKTKGKWSVQSVDDLPNGYAFKYTVSLFYLPSGKNFEGVGLTPDVEVTMDERTLGRASAAAKIDDRLALDVQLRTAKALLVGR